MFKQNLCFKTKQIFLSTVIALFITTSALADITISDANTTGITVNDENVT
ncbi:MAG: hypothetical protein GXP61_08805, partial [Epsilonproteobacteria bacterium]|nr:hypothetical protein [Campylobacterota bacterium]